MLIALISIIIDLNREGLQLYCFFTVAHNSKLSTQDLINSKERVFARHEKQFGEVFVKIGGN